MEILQFKTNLNCSGCVAKLSPYLDGENQIEEWSVDVKNADKLLTVKSTGISTKDLINTIALAGFVAKSLHQQVDLHQAQNHDCCTKPEVKPETAFWSETPVWKKAASNTFNCLIGCTIGDFTMITYLQAFHSQMNMWLMMGLAMLAGIATSILLETFILKIKERLAWKFAFQTAIGMSLISMIAMELAENFTDLTITGGQMAVSNPMYWFAMLPSIMAGFLIPLPYNYFKLKKYGVSCH